MLNIKINSGDLNNLCNEYLAKFKIDYINDVCIDHRRIRFMIRHPKLKIFSVPIHINLLSAPNGKIRVQVLQNTIFPLNGILNDILQGFVKSNSVDYITRDNNYWDIDLNSLLKEFNIPFTFNHLNLSEENLEIDLSNKLLN